MVVRTILVVVGGFAISTALGVVALIVFFEWFYDDPLDPGFSRGKAREVVAEELCKSSPDHFEDLLTVQEDSGVYEVYMFSENVSFGVYKRSDGNYFVDGTDERSRAFMAYTRAACASEQAPPRPGVMMDRGSS